MGPIIQTVMHCLIHPLSSKSIPLRLWVSDFMNQSTHKSSCYVPSSNTAFCTANRNRPTSLFSPVSSSSDQLQGYQKTYNHQQVFSQQQGTDRARYVCIISKSILYAVLLAYIPHFRLSFSVQGCVYGEGKVVQPASDGGFEPASYFTNPAASHSTGKTAIKKSKGTYTLQLRRRVSGTMTV